MRLKFQPAMIERFQRWLASPEMGTSEMNRRARLLHGILVVLIPATFGFLVVLALLNPDNQTGILAAAGVLATELVTLWLLHRGRVMAAGMGMLLALWVLLAISMYFGAGVRSVSALGQMLIVLMAGLLVSGSFASGLTVLTILYNYILYLTHSTNPLLGTTALTPLAYWATQSLFFIIAVGLTQVYVRRLRTAFSEAQAKEDSLMESVANLRAAQATQATEEANLRRRGAILAAVSVAAERLFRGRSFADSINQVVQELGHATGVDRVRIFENASGQGGDLMSHEVYAWAAEGVGGYLELGRFKSMHFREAGLMRWVDVLSNNQTINTNVQNLPDLERRRLQSQGLKSILIVPIFVGDEWWGFIGFDEIKAEREWSSEEEDALRGAAGILGGALQRQRVERALHRSQQHYLAILQDQTDMICRYTPYGQITFANEAYLRFFGLPADISKLQVWEQMPSEEAARDLRGKIEAITLDRPFSSSRNQNPRADGVLRWVEWTDRGIFDENGVLVEVQAAGRDVDNEMQLREELERNLRASETQAMTDELTGLLNRRAITERAELEWQRAQQDRTSFSLVLLDVDHLKEINDTHGHLAGDEALRTLGNLLKTSMRRNDWAGRWGGDEFLLLLPGSDQKTARQVAERLRERVNRSRVRLESGIEEDLRVSLGVVSNQGSIGSLDGLFAEADRALYGAKQAGRNQVGVAEDSMA